MSASLSHIRSHPELISTDVKKEVKHGKINGKRYNISAKLYVHVNSPVTKHPTATLTRRR